MDPRHLFVDERLTGICAYCGGTSTTGDHVPSKILLDEPYPPDLPVVPACNKCNEGFSSDELYVACLIECVLSGSAEPDGVGRTKIKRILEKKPLLQTRLIKSRRIDDRGDLCWEADVNRVRTVVLKLARGHAVYELNLPQLEDPRDISIAPLVAMFPHQIAAFKSPLTFRAALWPEVGSRAFIRISKSQIGAEAHGWLTVQPNRYRYTVEQTGGLTVKMVLSEYLACRVVWD